jgi:RNA polymerase sigma-70 factor (ECF subfamily)
MAAPDNIQQIWSRFDSNLRAFILSRVKNEADTSDILQEAYIRLHENIADIKEAAAIKSWIYKVSLNLIADHYRKQENKDSAEASSKDLYIPEPKNRYMDIAISDMIQMMDELPPEYCEALCLTEIEGLSQKEYAEKKGLSYSGAKSRVQRARMMLRDMLLKCCHYQFDKYGTVYDIHPKCCCC